MDKKTAKKISNTMKGRTSPKLGKKFSDKTETFFGIKMNPDLKKKFEKKGKSFKSTSAMIVQALRDLDENKYK